MVLGAFIAGFSSILTGVTISSGNIDGLGMLNAPGSQVSFDPASGTVFILEGALSRQFVVQKDGSYHGVGADHATG
jgi:hypothetical protein